MESLRQGWARATAIHGQLGALVVGLVLILAPIAMATGLISPALGLLAILGIGLCSSPAAHARHAVAARGRTAPTRVEQAARYILIAIIISLTVAALFLFAIPYFPGRVSPFTNDARAITAMRSVLTAQSEFQASAQRDTNRDGIGEYGTFAQLTAAEEGRPARLGPSFTEVLPDTPRGERLVRGGFVFHMLVLPPSESRPKGYWICIAWPVMHSRTGKLKIVADASGEAWYSRNQNHCMSGTGLENITQWLPDSGVPAMPPGDRRRWRALH